MLVLFRAGVSSIISLSIALTTPAPLFAATPSASAQDKTESVSPEKLANDVELLYWGRLQEEEPIVADFATGEPPAEHPLWQVPLSSPLLDRDPFFMRSQEWQTGASDTDCASDDVCAEKNSSGGVDFTYAGRTLRLNQALTPIFANDTYTVLSADGLELFQAKVGDTENPGEGFFYVKNKEFIRAAKYNSSVPIYFFPLPGAGWTGPNPNVFENDAANQLVLFNQSGFGLPIDFGDIDTMEQISSQNLVLAQTWSVLEGDVAANGVALPWPNSTLIFGTILSNQLPKPRDSFAQNSRSAEKVKELVARMGQSVLPRAHADELEAQEQSEEQEQPPTPLKTTLRQRIDAAVQSRLAELDAAEKARIEKLAKEKAELEQRQAEREAAHGVQLDLPLGDEPQVAAPPPAESAPAAKPGVLARFSSWMKGKLEARKEKKAEAKVNRAEPYLPMEELKKDNKEPGVFGSLRRWITPTILYGGKGAAAIAIASTVDINWAGLISSDMPQRITTVASLFGVVLTASIAMKYSIHKAYFDKKYPKTPDETLLQRLNKEHKGILDEFTQGLWTASAMLPQGIRHLLDALKDRFIPNNKLLDKAWEATIGFAMQASSRLPTNWKTFYLGAIVFGMSDSLQVLVDLLIFGPFFAHLMGYTIGGAVTATFVSATILSQFVGYLRDGAHNYSSDIKMINLKSADEIARSKMVDKGINPNLQKNDRIRKELREAELEKRYKLVGLPGKDEFLYDPITILEKIMMWMGFTLPEELNEVNRLKAGKYSYGLGERHWNKVTPIVNRALAMARAAQEKSPSRTGEQVVQLLTWAQDRKSARAVVGRAWDISASRWARDEMAESVEREVMNDLKTEEKPSRFKLLQSALKGALRYLALDSTKTARDIRSVAYLMSTAGSPFDQMEFLPASWREKAGSAEAAQIGAELINRAYNSYMEFDKAIAVPSSELEAEYGARTQALMARIEQRQPGVFGDPFARQVRYEELMARLKAKDKERREVLDFDPNAAPKLPSWVPESAADWVKGSIMAVPNSMSEYERKKWDIAREEVRRFFADQADTDEQVEREWLGISKRYVAKTGARNPQLGDLKEWGRTYRYRMVVAKAIAEQVGLYIEDPEKSELVKRALVQAALGTESLLRQRQNSFYASSLNDEDRRFYEAQIFSRKFIDVYVDMAVRDDFRTKDGLSAHSREFPGRFQGRRIKTQGKVAGRLRASLWRTVELAVSNEETAYHPTYWGWIERNVPLLPTMWNNFVRIARYMPYSFAIGWPISYYLWQLHVPFYMYVIGFTLAFIHPTLVEMNSRLMRAYDIKPMDDVPSKLTYAFMHSTLTNPQVMVESALTEKIGSGIENYMVKPAYNAFLYCEDMLSPKPVPANP